VQPPGRFGAVETDGDHVRAFLEKPRGDGAWINGGFFVLSPRVGEYIDGDETTWEREPLERLAREGELLAYRYDGFWQMVDTMRDKQYLERRWEEGAPWKVW
jgi:glucose-1-phosphate cytidylyltransferase